MSSTLNAILSEMQRFETSKGAKRNFRDYPDPVIKFLEVRVFPENYQVVFRSQIDSMSGPHMYEAIVMFSRLALKDTKEKGYVPVQDIKTRQTYYIVPATFNTPINIKCSCTDFRHTWETDLYKKGALVGKPRKYKRKTTYWPERNPKHVLGFCKHINAVLQVLLKSGTLRP